MNVVEFIVVATSHPGDIGHVRQLMTPENVTCIYVFVGLQPHGSPGTGGLPSQQSQSSAVDPDGIRTGKFEALPSDTNPFVERIKVIMSYKPPS